MKNKNGSFFVTFVTIMGIVVLAGLLILLFVKQENLEGGEPIGEKQAKLFLEYSKGETLLYYVDESVKRSIETATIEAAEKGLKGSSACGTYKGSTIWSCQDMDSVCSPSTTLLTPTDQQAEDYFVGVFKNDYDARIDELKNRILFGLEKIPNIPTEYDSLSVEKNLNDIELIGIATEPIVLTRFRVKDGSLSSKYKVNPSFREDIEVNFVDDKIEIAGKIPGFIGDDKDVIESKLDESWNLENYDTISHSPSCSYDTSEECTYDCNPQRVCELECDDGEGLFCCKYGDDFTYDSCEGSIIEVIEYSDVYATFSIGTGVNFNQYNPTTSEVEEKEVRYNLGISWIEQTGCSQSCNGHDSVDC